MIGIKRDELMTASVLLAVILVAFAVTREGWSEIVQASLHTNGTGAGVLAFFAAGEPGNAG